MINRLARSIALGLLLLGATAQAQTLPLPENLLDLRSEEGERLLFESDALEALCRSASTS